MARSHWQVQTLKTICQLNFFKNVSIISYIALQNLKYIRSNILKFTFIICLKLLDSETNFKLNLRQSVSSKWEETRRLKIRWSPAS